VIWRIAATVVVGVATGLLSAMFGVGGAVVSTPAIRALGASALEAVGTTLPSILPSAVTGTLRYRRAGLVEWRIVAVSGPAGAAAAVGGSFLSRAVPGRGHLLMVATAVLLGFAAVRAGLGRHEAVEPAEEEDQARPRRRVPGWRRAVIGLIAGGLSGLLGVGGGIVLVPAFTAWLGLPIKRAVGTSLACVGIIAVPGTLTHAFLGDIDWAFAVPLSVAVVPGAAIGARLAIRATDRTLRGVVAVALGGIAVLYGLLELLSLR